MKQEKIYHIIWSDYDGTYHERFTYELDCLNQVAVLMELEHREDNGTVVLNVFYGVEVEITVTPPVVIKVEFGTHRESDVE